jgi:hypothetical protein
MIRNQKIAIMPTIGRKLIHAGGAAPAPAAAARRSNVIGKARQDPE